MNSYVHLKPEPLFFGSRIVGKSGGKMWVEYGLIDRKALPVHFEVYCFNRKDATDKWVLGDRSRILAMITTRHIADRQVYYFQNKAGPFLIPDFLKADSVPVSVTDLAAFAFERYRGVPPRDIYISLHRHPPVITSALDDALCAHTIWSSVSEGAGTPKGLIRTIGRANAA